jgi:hypothetical protein
VASERMIRVAEQEIANGRSVASALDAALRVQVGAGGLRDLRDELDSGAGEGFRAAVLLAFFEVGTP